MKKLFQTLGDWLHNKLSGMSGKHKLILITIPIMIFGTSGGLLINSHLFQTDNPSDTPIPEVVSEATAPGEIAGISTGSATPTSSPSPTSAPKVKANAESKLTPTSSPTTTPSLTQPIPGKPTVSSENMLIPLSQSQILQDRANQALLDSLEEKDTEKVWERFYIFNDAWRENPSRNCRNVATYNYEIAKMVLGIMQDDLIRKYGRSADWRNAIEFTFKSWCSDRGY